MRIQNPKLILFFALALFYIPANSVFAGHSSLEETDSAQFTLTSYFDLRDRDTFIQVTNISSGSATIHIQIFNVPNLCNENDFFDVYTGNDTHKYNLRDILTNDGNPSGVVLPEDAYGIVFISNIDPSEGVIVDDFDLIGNMRLIDINGYEYRTNLAAHTDNFPENDDIEYIQFNTAEGTTLSDVIGITLDEGEDGDVEAFADPIDAYTEVDVDILDINENIFSCRSVIFACIDENSPRFEELLSESSLEFGPSVAALEYGINNALPHSRGGELLCPGNTIDNGIVRFTFGSLPGDIFIGYIGLNNDNGRGSFDGWFQNSDVTPFPGDNEG